MSYFDEAEDFDVIDQIMANGEPFNPLSSINDSNEYEEEILQELLGQFKKKKDREEDENIE